MNTILRPEREANDCVVEQLVRAFPEVIPRP